MIEKRISIRGLEIYVKIIGQGEPLIFLHGGPGGEHRYFLPHLEPLCEKYQLIFYDQRGCGLSESPNNESDYTMLEEVETLEILRKELKISKLNIIGESWGSMLGLLYASTYPENVEKLLLTAVIGATYDGFTIFGQELEKRLTKEDLQQLTMISPRVEAGEVDVQDLFKIIDPYYVFSKEALQRKTKTKSNAIVNHWLSADIKSHYDLRDNLHVLRNIPILIIQGKQDLIQPAMLDDLLLKYIPHAQLHIFEESGHWTVIEKPDAFMEAINEYF